MRAGHGLLLLGWMLFLAGAVLAGRVLGGAQPAPLLKPIVGLFASSTASLGAGLWLVIRRHRTRRRRGSGDPTGGPGATGDRGHGSGP